MGGPGADPGDCVVQLHDRDVILVNRDTPHLSWRNAMDANFKTQQSFTPPVPGEPAVSFDRGWASIDVEFEGERFRFVNTHFEVEDFPRVQFAAIGASRSSDRSSRIAR